MNFCNIYTIFFRELKKTLILFLIPYLESYFKNKKKQILFKKLEIRPSKYQPDNPLSIDIKVRRSLIFKYLKGHKCCDTKIHIRPNLLTIKI